jgi:hypothetical protein
MLKIKITNILGFASLTLGLFLPGTPVQALTLSGDVVEIAAPAAPAVLSGALQSDSEMRVFFESKFLPGAAIPVDVASPGGIYGNNNTSPGSVSGFEVSSYFVHFDPVTSAIGRASISFDHDIVGLILTDATLDATDSLGAVGTAYPTGLFGRRVEGGGVLGGEGVTWLGSSPNTIDLFFGAGPVIDQVRVITRTPEPQTYITLGMGLLLAAVARRRIQAEARTR